MRYIVFEPLTRKLLFVRGRIPRLPLCNHHLWFFWPDNKRVQDAQFYGDSAPKIYWLSCSSIGRIMHSEVPDQLDTDRWMWDGMGQRAIEWSHGIVTQLTLCAHNARKQTRFICKNAIIKSPVTSTFALCITVACKSELTYPSMAWCGSVAR